MSLTLVKLAPTGFTWHKKRVHFEIYISHDTYLKVPAGITRKKMMVSFSKM
jgi:hypothetical protein